MGDDREEKPLTRLSAYCASTPISVSLFVIMTPISLNRLDSVTVTVRPTRRLRWRLRIAGALIRLAGWVGTWQTIESVEGQIVCDCEGHECPNAEDGCRATVICDCAVKAV